jgi:hypothetical protein
MARPLAGLITLSSASLSAAVAVSWARVTSGALYSVSVVSALCTVASRAAGTYVRAVVYRLLATV